MFLCYLKGERDLFVMCKKSVKHSTINTFSADRCKAMVTCLAKVLNTCFLKSSLSLFVLKVGSSTPLSLFLVSLSLFGDFVTVDDVIHSPFTT